jgi:amidase
MPKIQYFLVRLLASLNAGWLIKASGAIERTAESNFEHFPNTPLFNVTGQPAMSVPLCWNESGLPIGMQFVGRYADEATLFRLAGQLEKALPWKDRVPPICSKLG